jgi:hypothetical protein
MKFIHLFIGLIFFLGSQNTSLALISVGIVSVENAKEMGIELRAKPGGPNHAWVDLEFKAEGKLEQFQQVSLEIADGDELDLGWTPLKDVRTSLGTVLVRVIGSRAFLKKVVLRIVHGTFGGVGHDIPLKDFVDFDNLDKPEPTNQSRQVKQQGGVAPAATSGSK